MIGCEEMDKTFEGYDIAFVDNVIKRKIEIAVREILIDEVSKGNISVNKSREILKHYSN